MKNNKYAVIDCRLSQKCKDSLVNFGFSLIEIPKNDKYDEAISAHPDIFMFLSEKNILIDEDISHIICDSNLISRELTVMQKRTNVLDGKIIYPNDCSVNFAKVGRYLIGKSGIADKQLVKIAREEECEFINVNQGYAKCNVCVVSDNAIITEDAGIAEECINISIDVLLLKTHSVKLDCYDYGFIGGSCGTEFRDDKNIIYFCGCIENHPEYKDIKEFCRKHNSELVSLSEEDLYDRGSIFFI